MRPAPALHIGDVTSVPSCSHPRLRTDKRVDPTSAVRPVSGFALSRARMGEQNRDTPASASSNEIGTLWALKRQHQAATPVRSERPRLFAFEGVGVVGGVGRVVAG